jgi:hypothetical protein
MFLLFKINSSNECLQGLYGSEEMKSKLDFGFLSIWGIHASDWQGALVQRLLQRTPSESLNQLESSLIYQRIGNRDREATKGLCLLHSRMSLRTLPH